MVQTAGQPVGERGPLGMLVIEAGEGCGLYEQLMALSSRSGFAAAASSCVFALSGRAARRRG